MKVVSKSVDKTQTIERSINNYYKLKCLFDRRLNVSSSTVKVSDYSKVFEVVSQTNFTATMQLYKSDSFATLASSPLEVSMIAYEKNVPAKPKSLSA